MRDIAWNSFFEKSAKEIIRKYFFTFFFNFTRTFHVSICYLCFEIYFNTYSDSNPKVEWFYIVKFQDSITKISFFKCRFLDQNELFLKVFFNHDYCRREKLSNKRIKIAVSISIQSSILNIFQCSLKKIWRRWFFFLQTMVEE